MAQRSQAAPGDLQPGPRGRGCSIIIPAYRGADCLDACVASIREHAPEAELIIVDDASGDGTAEHAERAFPEARLLRNPTNVGFGASCNRGAAAARSDVLLFLNQDALLESSVDVVSSRFAREADLGIVGGLVTGVDGRLSYSQGRALTTWRLVAHWWMYAARLANRDRFGGLLVSDRAAYAAACDADWVSGSCMFARRSVFEDVGGFSHDYFMYVEDVDLCERVGSRGARVGFDPAVRIEHVERGGAGQSVGIGAFAMRHSVVGQCVHLERLSGRWAAAWALIMLLPCFAAYGCGGALAGRLMGSARATANGRSFRAAFAQGARTLVSLTLGRGARASAPPRGATDQHGSAAKG